MIVDSSALVAIVRGEPDADALTRKIVSAPVAYISAASYVEAAIVVDRIADPVASRRFDDFLKETEMAIAPVTESQAKIARAAYRDFGKGSGHPAQLNFGDCFAYALSKERGEPLLFKGSDFTKAGVEAA